MKGLVLVVGLVVFASFSGCMGEKASASAELKVLNSSGGQGATAGWANFTESGGKLTIQIDLRGVPAGEHGTHIHMNGACGSTTANGTTTVGGAAGGHFNPSGAKHPQHAGDLGNINVQSGGTGTLTFTSNDLTLKEGDEMSVLGRSVVVHAGKDDLQTDPSGNSGARLLCGVITKT